MRAHFVLLSLIGTVIAALAACGDEKQGGARPNSATSSTKSTGRRTKKAMAEKASKPVAPVIEINLESNCLRVVKAGKVILQTNVGTASSAKYPGAYTPVGRFRIQAMEVQPTYRPKGAQPVPPGPDNPLGTRWMFFHYEKGSAFGIHGTNEPALIEHGTTPAERRVSHGCIRVTNSVIEKIYAMPDIVPGTVVVISARLPAGQVATCTGINE